MGWVGSVMDMGKTAYQTIQNPEDSMLDDEALEKSKNIRETANDNAAKSLSTTNIADKMSLLNQANSAQALGRKDFYNQVQGSMETIGSTISGAASGGWVGAILGFVSGASKQIIGGIQSKRKAEEEKRKLKRLQEKNAKMANQSIKAAQSAAFSTSIGEFKYGGKKYNKYNTFMSDYSNGFNYFGSGGSHEENPYQGVQVGIDPQGVPNMVEEGESIFKDFVFSKRLHPSFAERKQLIKELGLSKSQIKGKSYSDLATYLSKESKERPNDPISRASLNKMLDKLATSQERCKEAKKQAQTLEMFELAPAADKARILDLAAQQYKAQQQQAAQEQAYMQKLQQEQQMQSAAQQGYLTPEQQQQLVQQAQMQGQALQGYACGGHVNKYGWGSLIASAAGQMFSAAGNSGNKTQGGKGARTNDGITSMFDIGKSIFSSASGGKDTSTATNNLFAGLDQKIGDKLANSKMAKGFKSIGAQATDTNGNPVAASEGLSTAQLNFDFSGMNGNACGGKINRYDDGGLSLSTLTQEQYDALSDEDYLKLLKQFEVDKSKVKAYPGSSMTGGISNFAGFDKKKNRYTLDYLKKAQRLQNDEEFFNKFMSSGAFESFAKQNKQYWDTLSIADKMKLAAGLATDYRGSSTPFAYSDFHKGLEDTQIHRNRGFVVTKGDQGEEIATPIENYDPNNYVAQEGYGIQRVGTSSSDGVNYNDYYYGEIPVQNSSSITITNNNEDPEISTTEDDYETIVRKANRPNALSTAGRYAPAVASAIMATTNANDDFTAPLDNRAYRTAQFQPISGNLQPNLIDPNWVRAQENARNAQAMALASQGNINPLMRAQMLSELMKQGQMNAQNAVLEAYKHNNEQLQKVAQFNLDRDKFNAQGAYSASRDNMRLNDLNLQRDAMIARQKMQQSENFKDRRDAYISSFAQGLSDVAKENFFINQWNSNEGVNKGYYIGADGSIVSQDGEVTSKKSTSTPAKEEEYIVDKETKEAVDIAKKYNQEHPQENTIDIDGATIKLSDLTDQSGKKVTNEQLEKLTDEKLGMLVEDGMLSEEDAATIANNRDAHLAAKNSEITQKEQNEQQIVAQKEQSTPPHKFSKQEESEFINRLQYASQSKGGKQAAITTIDKMVQNNNISLSEANRYRRILNGENPEVTRRLTVGERETLKSQIDEARKSKGGIQAALKVIEDGVANGNITEGQAYFYRQQLLKQQTKLTVPTKKQNENIVEEKQENVNVKDKRKVKKERQKVGEEKVNVEKVSVEKVKKEKPLKENEILIKQQQEKEKRRLAGEKYQEKAKKEIEDEIKRLERLRDGDPDEYIDYDTYHYRDIQKKKQEDFNRQLSIEHGFYNREKHEKLNSRKIRGQRARIKYYNDRIKQLKEMQEQHKKNISPENLYKGLNFDLRY